ncbi:MAG: disulfide bond formation protein B [Patescibacteria group bacterium]
MSETVSQLNFLLSLATLGAQVVVILLIIGLLLRARFIAMLAPHALWLSFAAALGASALSLVYSNIIGFDPCSLCWWQRIFIYPQVVLLGLALWRKDTNSAVVDSSIVLSALGALVAAYHYYGQMFNASALPCDADGAVSCAKIYFVEFGFVTMPLMALTAFVLLLALLFVHKQKHAA